MMKRWWVLILCVCSFNFLYFPVAEGDSIEVNEGSLPQLLLAIATTNNLNLVLDSQVNGKITISLQNMKPKAMLQTIALGNDLNYQERGNIIYIRPNHSWKQLHTVELHYLDLNLAAEKVNLVLSKDKSNVKGEENKQQGGGGEKVVVNPLNNTITFYADDREYESIKEVLTEADKAPRQVSLEAKIVALEKSASKDLGLDWSWSELPARNILGDGEKWDGKEGKYKEGGEWDKYRTPYGTALRFGKNITGMPYEIGLSAKLNALISHGRADILAKPNITTLQGEEAVINIGGEVPVQTTVIADNTTTTSVTYRQAGIILRCKPRVNEDGIITVEVHTEVSNPSYIQDLKAFRFQKRSADTIVRLKQGETMVIGGLINQDEINNMSSVPLLSKIPLLGNLFKHSQRTKRSTEVMIFLTAKEV